MAKFFMVAIGLGVGMGILAEIGKRSKSQNDFAVGNVVAVTPQTPPKTAEWEKQYKRTSDAVISVHIKALDLVARCPEEPLFRKTEREFDTVALKLWSLDFIALENIEINAREVLRSLEYQEGVLFRAGR